MVFGVRGGQLVLEVSDRDESRLNKCMNLRNESGHDLWWPKYLKIGPKPTHSRLDDLQCLTVHGISFFWRLWLVSFPSLLILRQVENTATLNTTPSQTCSVPPNDIFEYLPTLISAK